MANAAKIACIDDEIRACMHYMDAEFREMKSTDKFAPVSRVKFNVKVGTRSVPLHFPVYDENHPNDYKQFKLPATSVNHLFCVCADPPEGSIFRKFKHGHEVVSDLRYFNPDFDVNNVPEKLMGQYNYAKRITKNTYDSILQQWYDLRKSQYYHYLFIAYLDEFTAFNDWCSNFDDAIIIKSVTITDCNFFGSAIGFLKLNAEVYLNQNDADKGKAAPGVAFLRGGSVAMLPILINTEDKKAYTCLTSQARVPIGKRFMYELPAGMLDNGTFKGTASKEIHEELNIEATEDEIVDLNPTYKCIIEKKEGFDPVYKYLPGLYPSCGGCDEFMRFCMFYKEINFSTIEKMNAAITGNTDEGESIQLVVLPIDEHLYRKAADFKLITALFFFERLFEKVMRCPYDAKRVAEFVEELQHKRSEKHDLNALVEKSDVLVDRSRLVPLPPIVHKSMIQERHIESNDLISYAQRFHGTDGYPYQ